MKVLSLDQLKKLNTNEKVYTFIKNMNTLNLVNIFKELKKYSPKDTVWLSRNLLDTNSLVNYAIKSSELVLPLYEKSFIGDDKLRILIDTTKDIYEANETLISTFALENLYELSRTAYQIYLDCFFLEPLQHRGNYGGSIARACLYASRAVYYFKNNKFSDNYSKNSISKAIIGTQEYWDDEFNIMRKNIRNEIIEYGINLVINQ
jgi:hypothetical protein